LPVQRLFFESLLGKGEIAGNKNNEILNTKVS
jgi:hypothetical protein